MKLMELALLQKANLLKNYKNIQNIKTAKLDELMTIKGINEKIAQQIISYNNLMALFINLTYQYPEWLLEQ